MKKLCIIFALSSLITVGCGTMHTAGNTNTELEQLARSYRDNGDIEGSIETYKKLIASNPHHFNSVLYQHEIMRTTEGLSDPWLLVEEIRRTSQMFKTACDENYEGATPEAIQLEHDALIKYIFGKGKEFHELFLTFKKDIYASVSTEIYKIPIDNNSVDSKNYCEALYYFSDAQYFSKNYHASAANFTKVLDECNSETQWNAEMLGDYQRVYEEAAHGAVLAYYEIMESDECPKIPETTVEMFENQTFTEYPIAECRANFIDAALRYYELAKDAEYSINALYWSARIYHQHNQFDKAVPLFKLIIQSAPMSDVAVYSANYLLETYRIRKQYEMLGVTIRELKDNHDFMSYKSPLSQEFFELMNGYEEALIEYNKKEKSNR